MAAPDAKKNKKLEFGDHLERLNGFPLMWSFLIDTKLRLKRAERKQKCRENAKRERERADTNKNALKIVTGRNRNEDRKRCRKERGTC